jgi:aryl-alcohol dehydrogenase-like predicted oxidoreductase
MKYRILGQSEISIAPIVFGGNVFGWTADEQRSFELLDALVDSGINMIDTADMYSAWAPGNSGGESETIIGKWLSQSGNRDKIVLATKVGNQMGDGSKGLSKSHILKSAEDSLKRLNTDYIDVYYSHSDDTSVAFDEVLEAHQKLIKEGKVRYIASSNYEPDRLKGILEYAEQNDLPKYVAHQPEYNLFDRGGYETGVEQICADNNLAVVTYFSLASGFLSGKYRTAADLEKSNRGAGFLKKYMTSRGLAILDGLDKVAKSKGVSAAVVAIAWILGRPSVTAPIVSATSVSQLDELVLAADISLSDDEMQLLNDVSLY